MKHLGMYAPEKHLHGHMLIDGFKGWDEYFEPPDQPDVIETRLSEVED